MLAGNVTPRRGECLARRGRRFLRVVASWTLAERNGVEDGIRVEFPFLPHRLPNQGGDKIFRFCALNSSCVIRPLSSSAASLVSSSAIDFGCSLAVSLFVRGCFVLDASSSWSAYLVRTEIMLY